MAHPARLAFILDGKVFMSLCHLSFSKLKHVYTLRCQVPTKLLLGCRHILADLCRHWHLLAGWCQQVLYARGLADKERRKAKAGLGSYRADLTCPALETAAARSSRVRRPEAQPRLAFLQTCCRASTSLAGFHEKHLAALPPFLHRP